MLALFSIVQDQDELECIDSLGILGDLMHARQAADLDGVPRMIILSYSTSIDSS